MATAGDKIRARRAQESENEVREILEGSLEGVEMTAHALWMHSMDLVAMKKNTPQHFSDEVWADIAMAHRRLSQMLGVRGEVVIVQSPATLAEAIIGHPVSEDAA